jgi:uracil-DNA glycosylase
MSRAVDVLLEFLRNEEARGVTHVHLDDQTKELLRQLHRQAKASASPAPKAATPTPAARQTTPASAPAQQPALQIESPEEKAGGIALPELTPTSGTPGQQILALAAQAENWKAARQLGSLRDTMVFSTGNPEAELMLIGEAPGYHEERQRQPFVGPAGQKLDDILRAMGIERASVYISNIVKFRPALPNQTTNNRKPTPEEMAACLPFIRAEVEIVKPKVIIALGATAAEGLLGLSGAVAHMRERWHDFQGIPSRVTYHPAYLLHGTSAQQDKRKIWEDMLAVMEMLKLPISDKQRGYFLPKR